MSIPKKINHRVLTRREFDYTSALNYLSSLLSENKYVRIDPLVMSAAYRFGHRQLNALLSKGYLTKSEGSTGVFYYRKEEGFDQVTGVQLAAYCLEVDRDAEKRATRQWERKDDEEFFD